MFSPSQELRSRSVVRNLLGDTSDELLSVGIKAFTGAIPFNDKSPRAAILAITSGERPTRLTHPSVTDGLWALIQQCWDQEAHLRPRALRISCGL